MAFNKEQTINYGIDTVGQGIRKNELNIDQLFQIGNNQKKLFNGDTDPLPNKTDEDIGTLWRKTDGKIYELKKDSSGYYWDLLKLSGDNINSADIEIRDKNNVWTGTNEYQNVTTFNDEVNLNGNTYAKKINMKDSASGGQGIDMAGTPITWLANPTNNQDAATKVYVDTQDTNNFNILDNKKVDKDIDNVITANHTITGSITYKETTSDNGTTTRETNDGENKIFEIRNSDGADPFKVLLFRPDKKHVFIGSEEDYIINKGLLATGGVSIQSTYGARGINGIAIGSRTMASGENSIALGYQSNTYSNYAASLGRENNCYGITSIGIGYRNTANGDYSWAIHNRTRANAYASISEGFYSIARQPFAKTFSSDGRCVNGVSGSGGIITCTMAREFESDGNWWRLYLSPQETNYELTIPTGAVWYVRVQGAFVRLDKREDYGSIEGKWTVFHYADTDVDIQNSPGDTPGVYYNIPNATEPLTDDTNFRLRLVKQTGGDGDTGVIWLEVKGETYFSTQPTNIIAKPFAIVCKVEITEVIWQQV